MQLDYAIEGYWLVKRRDFSANTVNDYTLTFKRLAEFVGKTRDLRTFRARISTASSTICGMTSNLSEKTILTTGSRCLRSGRGSSATSGYPTSSAQGQPAPPRRRLSAAYTEAEIRSSWRPAIRVQGGIEHTVSAWRSDGRGRYAIGRSFWCCWKPASGLGTDRADDARLRAEAGAAHHPPRQGDKKRVVFLGTAAKQGL